MYLVEIYLPITTPQGEANSKDLFGSVRQELTEQFGGVTAFMRAPASGLWEDPKGNIQQDDIVIFEVIAKTLNRKWWRHYRIELEKRFAQESIVVHAAEIETL